jgi:plastocyanin
MNPTQQPEQPVFQQTPVKSGKGKKVAAIILAIIAVAAIVGGAVWWFFQSQADAELQKETASVSITGDAYDPGAITVKSGEDVTWTNNSSSAHELAADAESLPDFGGGEALNAGDTYTYTFSEKGTYHYYNPTDPAKYTGTVIVE